MEKPYACDSCDYRSSDHNSLRRHKMRHSGVKPYKCPHCPYASIQCSTFKVHLKSKHPGLAQDIVFQCDNCGFKTVRKGNYLAHMAQHELEKGGEEAKLKARSSKTPKGSAKSTKTANASKAKSSKAS